jgi:release factor glutamine methyltransferase
MGTHEHVVSVGSARHLLAAAFRDAGLESPELDARVLIGHALGLDHAGLALAAERTLSANEASHIAALRARRLARESVAAIVGSKEFWGLQLRLNEATLVPRADTETVVEAALAAVDMGGPRTRSLRIADLGTGSGCLLLALLSELPDACGFGTDLSTSALKMARRNAHALGLAGRAYFAATSFADALTGPFQVIVSNPPYVPTCELATLQAETRREPRLALDGGTDGLAAYGPIAAAAARLLAPGGCLVCEVGIGQATTVREILAGAGLAAQEPRCDLAGIPRAVVALAQPMR